MKEPEIPGCCEEFREWWKVMDEIHLPVGEGEISGAVNLEDDHLSIDDGWTFVPNLKFNFCPFCGKKQRRKSNEINGSA